MADNDVLRRDGVLVRITGFDDELTAYFGVMPNGHTTQLTFPRQEVFDVGDVLLVGTDFYRKVPHDVWPLKPRVGIVRRALNEGVVLETCRRPRSRWRTLRHRLRASRASSRIKTPPGIIIGSPQRGEPERFTPGRWSRACRPGRCTFRSSHPCRRGFLRG